MTRFSTKAGVLSSVLGLLVFPGCATMRKTPTSAAPPVVELPVTPLAVPSAKALPAAKQIMLVESVPPGAIIVVNGRPVGKAPVRIAVPATPQGFFPDDMEIRARFVARDETEVSRTATEDFTPREKVPAVLHFTPDGAQRTVR
jgi:hypothetical protein